MVDGIPQYYEAKHGFIPVFRVAQLTLKPRFRQVLNWNDEVPDSDSTSVIEYFRTKSYEFTLREGKVECMWYYDKHKPNNDTLMNL